MAKKKVAAKSYAKDIRPLFRGQDIACMAGHGVRLDDYPFMSDAAGDGDFPDHANARKVLEYLKPGGRTPRMPMGGPYWPAKQLTLYAKWMSGGFAA